MGKGRGKGTKKGWKRIDNQNADEVLEEMHAQREMASKMDSELFVEDVEPKEIAKEMKMELTRRQRAALEHRMRISRLESADNDMEMKDVKEEIVPKAKISVKEEETKKVAKNKRRKTVNHRTTPYDIWEDEDKEPQNDGKHKKRSTYVPSVLPAIVPPSEGASYNPPLGSYLKMIGQVVKEEQRIEAIEQRMERRIGMDGAVGTRMALREELHCFVGESKGEEGTTEEVKDEVNADSNKESLSNKPKTMKEKKRQKARRTEAKRAVMEKRVQGKKRQQLQSLKSLNREVHNLLEQQQLHQCQRRRARAVKALTERKRLGRGKFEPYEEPVLSVEELPVNLRQLSSQGNILQERIKSLQQRNILPIAGERQQPNKARLRAKFVEKRSVKEVTSDSRVI